MGTPTFAVPVLDALVRQYGACDTGVRAVFTRKDAPRKRGKALVPSPVRQYADKRGIPVCTPRSFYAYGEDGVPLLNHDGGRLVDAEALASVKRYDPDFIAVAAYGMILPPEVLEIPEYGCINVHASLLPRWRGAAPIQRAILAGDTNAGISVMRMEAGLDTGAYCEQAFVPIGDMDYAALEQELSTMGANALCRTLPLIAAGDVTWTEQDDEAATYANKIEKGELNLDPSKSAQWNLRAVRASSAAAPAKCAISDKNVTVLSASLEPAKDAIELACYDGSIYVGMLRPDGKKDMTGRAFTAGIPRMQHTAAQKPTWYHI
jgi:methionyl-tRNA formyltransferase